MACWISSDEWSYDENILHGAARQRPHNCGLIVQIRKSQKNSHKMHHIRTLYWLGVHKKPRFMWCIYWKNTFYTSKYIIIISEYNTFYGVITVDFSHHFFFFAQVIFHLSEDSWVWRKFRTFDPIWLPHWPAWRCTISLIFALVVFFYIN